MKSGEGGLSLLDDVQRIQNVCQIKIKKKFNKYLFFFL